MARQKQQTIIKTDADDVATPGLPSMVESLKKQDVIIAETNDNAYAVAQHLGYEGAMTVGGLEDEIRFYQRRTAEACLELGKRLIILKELTPHGEFVQRIELLGLTARATQKFMQAAFKFSKSANLALLTEKIGSQSKLLELVTMDDDDIAQLANGESVRGLSLDAIDTLTTSQLKAALRESKLNYEAQGRVLEEKSQANDKLATALNARDSRVSQASLDEIAKELRSQATIDGFAAEHAISNQLAATFRALTEHSLDNGGEHKQFMLGLVTQIELELIKVREEFNLFGEVTTDDTPDWLKPGAELAVEKAEQEWAKRQAEFANETQAN